MSGAERGKYLFRIARGIAERARELAVVETLDNGKPIKETRDFDVPTAAQHFFYHAGWADKLQHLGLGPAPAAAGGGRPGDPLELPAADGGLEDRPGAGRRQHGGDQAGRDHPAVDPGAGRDHRRRRPAARRGQHRDRAPATSARTPGQPPRHRQGGLHRLDRRRPPDPAQRWPAPAARSPWSWAARARTSSSTTPPRTRPSRASSTASSSTRARSAAPGRGCWSRSRSPTSSSARLQGPGGDPAGRRPDGQEHRRRRDQLRRPAGADHHPDARPAWTRARGLDLLLPAAEERLLLRPDDLHRRHPVDADRPGGDLRPGADRDDLPDARRGGGQGQQHPVRAVRRGVDREGLPGDGHGRGAAGRGRLGQHLQPVRPDRELRRLQGVRLRPGGRARPGWPPTWTPTTRR